MSAACEHLSFEDDHQAHIRELGGFGAAALRLQRMGYAVLPLARGGKRPHRMLPETGGVHWATRDERMVPWAWRDRDPAANVGVATGSASHLMVIDLDVKSGPDGVEEFRRFVTDHKLTIGWDTSPGVLTPSGGMHIWLRTPSGMAVPERPGILPGVDVKGDGGLVAAPPSRKLTTGMQPPGESAPEPVAVPYIWTRGCPCSVPDAPEWVLQWLAAAPGGGGSGTGRSPGGDPPDLARLLAEGIPRGQRNGDLYRLACSRMRSLDLDQAAVLADIEAAWRAGDTTGMPWREVTGIVASAHRFISAEVERDRAGAAAWRARGLGKPPPLQPSDALAMRGRLRRQAMASVGARRPR